MKGTKKDDKVVVCVSTAEKEEIKQWAACEGRDASPFMLQLFRDYKRRAKAEGLPMPVDCEVE